MGARQATLRCEWDGPEAAARRRRPRTFSYVLCRLVWNAGQPLLASRPVKRTFTLAANALEAGGSTAHELRAHLHLEIARCELAEDNASQARMHAQAALALDYLPRQRNDVQRYRLPRPLDRHLHPMLRVALAASGHAAQDALGQALARIEQARRSLSQAAAEAALAQALAVLRDADQQGADSGDAHEAHLRARALSLAWADVAVVASARDVHAAVLEAAARSGQAASRVHGDPEVAKLQARFPKDPSCCARRAIALKHSPGQLRRMTPQLCRALSSRRSEWRASQSRQPDTSCTEPPAAPTRWRTPAPSQTPSGRVFNRRSLPSAKASSSRRRATAIARCATSPPRLTARWRLCCRAAGTAPPLLRCLPFSPPSHRPTGSGSRLTGMTSSRLCCPTV